MTASGQSADFNWLILHGSGHLSHSVFVSDRLIELNEFFVTITYGFHCCSLLRRSYVECAVVKIADVRIGSV